MAEHARVRAVIDLRAVDENFENMRRNLNPGTKMIAVIKTNAYGHGAAKIASHIEARDYLWGFAVATAEEALELRESGIRKPVLILGVIFPESDEAVLRAGIRPSVFTLQHAQRLNEAARRLGICAPIHLAVDTGMTRIGLPASEAGADEAAAIAALENLHAEGLFTHFARADETDLTSAREQQARYLAFLEMLEARGVEPELRHTSNSAAILALPECQLDAVRAGISIYGIYPSDEVSRDIPLRPVMELKSHIAFIKTVGPGVPVSYGGTFVTSRTTRIATIPVGYGDGYPRLLSSKGSVLIGGKRAPILGRVCMDQFMVDVTDIPASEMDEVTLLGRDGDDAITAEELGELSGRFPYELVCDISPRVPRVYVPG